MKKLLFFFGTLSFFSITLIFYHLFSLQDPSRFKITSPLPNLLSKTLPGVLSANAEFWKPDLNKTVKSQVATPNISAESALAYDLSTNSLLFQKKIKEKLPMASLTKIMTAIVTLQNMDLEAEIEVSEAAAKVGEDSMGLEAHEKLRLEDLLYGLMLPSGNDAAEAIAQASVFGRENFIHLMNREAEELGLSDTHFTNPTGLEGDGNQYTTAYNLLVMTRYALINPEFAKIVSTYEYEIPQSDTHKQYQLYNETNLLTTYPGVKGVKTGYTDEAGLCLVTYLDYDGHKIIAILLNAENRRQEMKELLDYSLKTLGVKPPPHS